MTTFAPHTKCSVDQTKGDIQSIIAKYGGDDLRIRERPDHATIRFRANGRYVRFELPVPYSTQGAMSQWRALWLSIKAKLQSWESGIESFDEAFLAQIEDDEGRTIGEKVIPTLPKPKLDPKWKTIVCPYCSKSNRLPPDKDIHQANCGSCHRPLITNQPPQKKLRGHG